MFNIKHKRLQKKVFNKRGAMINKKTFLYFKLAYFKHSYIYIVCIYFGGWELRNYYSLFYININIMTLSIYYIDQ